jgi:hypothetical protein
VIWKTRIRVARETCAQDRYIIPRRAGLERRAHATRPVVRLRRFVPESSGRNTSKTNILWCNSNTMSRTQAFELHH